MATLVLNTVGTALGGPIGGALGSLVGQSIDRQLFGPGMRRGPRLGDLSVQTSSYGSPVPRIYGKMRVAGSVVWATDIREEEAIEGGGKGSPEYLAYRYSANFAVALSSRPILAVKRIWADGKLIRGAAGDFKVKTKFRLLSGDEDQAIDPLIASVETIPQTPAYRGMAMAVFEDLELGEFGNRIPVLTFEVEADSGPVAIGDLLTDASNGLIGAEAPRPIFGFAAHGSSIGNALADLIELGGLSLAERDGALRTPVAGPPKPVGREELGSGIDAAAAVERIRDADSTAPNSLTLTYYEPDRDYQTGQMRASSGHCGARDERIELAAAMSSGEAKALAEEALARRWLAGDRVKLQLPPAWMALRPGDTLQLPGANRIWLVRSVTIESMAVAVEAEMGAADVAPLPADSGRSVTEPDVAVGRSELALFELPAMGDAPTGSPIAYLAASNDGAWKPLPVELKLGQGPLTAMAVNRQTVLGHAETLLEGRCPRIADNLSSVIVRLVDPSQTLLNADEDALNAGANLAVLGEEMVQFGKAELLEEGLYRLSRLLRGCRGTEWAVQGHAAGDPFCLVDGLLPRSIILPPSAIGGSLEAVGHGVADAAPLPTAERSISGEALRPPAPCHLRLWRDDAVVRAEWVRRSHRGWAWIDGIGDPTDGFAELYQVTLTGPAGTIQSEAADRSASWTVAEIPAQPGQPIDVSVTTVGPVALSRAASASLIL